MGCWNGTCGVSQLSLNHGDPIAYFLLANVNDHEHNDSGYCYTEDIWCPIGLPIYGEYNDYGSIEQIQNMEAADHLVDLLKQHGVPIPPENEYRRGFDPTTLDFDQLEDALHQSIVRIRDRDGALSAVTAEKPSSVFRVGMMMVHRDVYEGLAQNYYHWLDGAIQLDRVFDNAQAAYRELVEKIKTRDLLEKYGPAFALQFILGHGDRGGDLLREFFFAYPIYARQYLESYAVKLLDAAGRGEEAPNLIQEICRFQIFRINMSALRKGWGPQAGAGSQQDNHEDHARLNLITENIIQSKRIRKRELDEEFEQLSKDTE